MNIGGIAALTSTAFWIGVSDIGEEDSFTYLSDETLVNFNCENSFEGRAGKTFKRLMALVAHLICTLRSDLKGTL